MIKTVEIQVKIFFEKSRKTLELTTQREALLDAIAEKIISLYKEEKKVNLNFICTHNSRRSQLGQIWGFYAKHYFNLPKISTFSGGTEVTAFFRNTVKTLQSVGFKFNLNDFSHQNPKYLVSFSEQGEQIECFSKLYDHKINKSPFIAITTCDSADANCPFIAEAISRFHLPFVDPKIFDGKDQQDDAYIKTSSQIAGELFYVFAKIAKEVNY